MRLKLLSAHYLGGRYLEAGTVVGDGPKDHPYSGPVSMEMEGLDEAGKKAVEAHRKGRANPIENIKIGDEK